MINLYLTPVQAKVLFNVVDEAADAGACEGGNTQQESEALTQISYKLINNYEKWKSIKLETE